jgi:hypothetical protein
LTKPLPMLSTMATLKISWQCWEKGAAGRTYGIQRPTDCLPVPVDALWRIPSILRFAIHSLAFSISLHHGQLPSPAATKTLSQLLLRNPSISPIVEIPCTTTLCSTNPKLRLPFCHLIQLVRMHSDPSMVLQHDVRMPWSKLALLEPM